MKKKHVQAMMAGMAAMLSISLPVTSVYGAVPEKEQTVYVTADESGKTQKVIVSNWLKNTEKESSLTDKSDLENIQNVKGEETFKRTVTEPLSGMQMGKISIIRERPRRNCRYL